MANLKGKLLICVHPKHNKNVILGLRSFATGALRHKGIEDEKIQQILATESVVVVDKMESEVIQADLSVKKYPTSPFELVIEHDQCQAFSLKGSKPGVRFRTNLTQLVGAKKVDGKHDRWAYAHSRRVECFDADKKGIERLSTLQKVADNLFAWKTHITTALEQMGLNPKDVSKYDLKKTLDEQYVGHTPYCVTLPEPTSGIVIFVAAIEGKNGTYYKQDFAWHWNIGLTHTGGSTNTNPDDNINKEDLAAGLAYMRLSEEDSSENPDELDFDSAIA